MRNKPCTAALLALAFMAILIAMGACANIGNPEGGPYDMTPPKLIRSNPPERTVRFNKQRIVLTFDENIQLNNQQENLIISPPQIKQPKITAVGKNIVLTLQDTLIPNTTYSFNFNEGVVDFTEGNPLEGFTFAFSTGDVLDTMQMSGVMIDARTLEPIQGKLVGVYGSEEPDSAFRSKSFRYATRTNKEGLFKIMNMADKSYRIYGLSDDDNNFYFSQPQERVAFDSVIYKTMCVPAHRVDTIKIDSINALRDTIQRDSLVHVDYIRYTPDSLVLRMFQEEIHRPGLMKSLRPDSNRITITFNTRVKDIPTLHTREGVALDKNAVLPTRNGEDEKVVDYWLLNRGLISSDSLTFLVDYEKLDSLNRVVMKRDTLFFAKPKVKNKENKKAAKNKEETAAESSEAVELLIKPQVKGTKGIYAGTPSDTLLISFDSPIATIYRDSIRLTYMKDSLDTIGTAQPYQLKPVEEMPTLYKMTSAWSAGVSYQLKMGKGAFVDVYGVKSEELSYEQKIQPTSELGILELSLKGNGLENAVVELLDKNDEVIGIYKPGYFVATAKDSTQNAKDANRKLQPGVSGIGQLPDSMAMVSDSISTSANSLSESKKEFMVRIADIVPGDYYARLFIDENKNGRWDTGSLNEKRIPEMVYYCPNLLSVKKGFTTGEKWEVYALRADKQKPNDLRKIKPEEKKPRVDKNIEYYKMLKDKKSNRANNQNQGRGGFGGGFGGGGGFGSGGGFGMPGGIGGGFQESPTR